MRMRVLGGPLLQLDVRVDKERSLEVRLSARKRRASLPLFSLALNLVLFP